MDDQNATVDDPLDMLTSTSGSKQRACDKYNECEEGHGWDWGSGGMIIILLNERSLIVRSPLVTGGVSSIQTLPFMV